MDVPRPKPIASRRKPIKVASALAHDIVDYIVDEDLKEGDRLPPERQMIAETGRARGSLREALRLLESRGVIEMRQGSGGGPVVRRPRAADLGQALTLLLMFEGGTIMDLVEARTEVEMLIIVRAARAMTAERLDRLRATVEDQRRHLDDRERFIGQSQLFYQIIGQASGNVVLSIISQTLVATAHQVFLPFEYPISDRQRVIASHEDVIDAFGRGDVDAACTAMRRHIEGSAQRWRRQAGPAADKPLRWSPLDSAADLAG